MYLYRETKDKNEMRQPAPIGAGACEQIVERAEKMEIWASSFMDAGEDYCEIRLIDKAGLVIDRRRVNGY